MVTATAPVTDQKTWWDTIGAPAKGKSGREFLASVGADFEVVKNPLFTNGVGDRANLMLGVGGKMATVRADTSQPIAVVGETYKVIQNHVLADLADALLEVEGGVVYTKGGLLNGGRIVYLIADLPERTFKIEGDDSPIMTSLILRTGHDGLTSLTFGPTAVRFFCQNQVNAAVKGLKDKVVIRHTVNAERSIDVMRKTIGFTGDYFDTLKKVYTELTKLPMTIEDVLKATEKLIPSTATAPEKMVKAQGQRDTIAELFRNSVDLRDMPDTAYKFYQAVAAYADHERTYRKTKVGSAGDARAVAILKGTAQGLKDHALTLVLPNRQVRAAGGRFVTTQVPA